MTEKLIQHQAARWHCCKDAVITQGNISFFQSFFLFFLAFLKPGFCCMSMNWAKHAWQAIVCGWKEGRGSQPHGGVSEGSVCNLQKMHAIDRHTTLSTRPLIARDVEEHMLVKEEGVSDVSNVQAYGSYKLCYINWKWHQKSGLLR